jgi:hypothetical protein
MIGRLLALFGENEGANLRRKDADLGREARYIVPTTSIGKSDFA